MRRTIQSSFVACGIFVFLGLMLLTLPVNTGSNRVYSAARATSTPDPFYTPEPTPTALPTMVPLTRDDNISVAPNQVSVEAVEGWQSTTTITFTNKASGTEAVEVRLEAAYAAPKAAFTSSPMWEPIQFPSTKIDPRLTAVEKSTAGAGTGKDILIYMQNQADVSPCYSVADWEQRGQCVIDALEAAQKTQAPVIAQLKAAGASGIQPLYIINAIAVRNASPELVQTVAANVEVAYVEASAVLSIPMDPVLPDQMEKVGYPGSSLEQANVFAMRREFGLLGDGVVVGNIDTGVDYLHPELADSYRGQWTGHAFAWFDATSEDTVVPTDSESHGTHVMGTMVGNTVGVAPNAQWIAARGCIGRSCYSYSLLEAGQWMLAPYRTDEFGRIIERRPALRPQVINNSWGGESGQLWYQAVVLVWRAAGINPVFSAGNSGDKGAGSIGSPADNAGTVSVCALSVFNTRAAFSSMGPGSLPGFENKPDICAPGGDVYSSIPGGGYQSKYGTSMAAPHVSGALALLRQLGLTAEQAETALYASAISYPTTGSYNYEYGRGRMDVRAAVAAAKPLERVPEQPAPLSIMPGRSDSYTLHFPEYAPGTYHYVLRWRFAGESTWKVASHITLEVRAANKLFLPPVMR